MSRGRKIWLFTAYHFQGSARDVLLRFTWEGLQTFIGWWVGVFTISRYACPSIQSFDGVVVVKVMRKHPVWGGVSFGRVILGDKRIDARLNNSLFMHEFGHCLQSRASGPIYLFKYGLPSLKSVTVKGHNLHPVEQDANQRAHHYFSQLDGYQGWPQGFLPILQHASSIRNHWWEYLPPIFPFIHLFGLLLPSKRLPETPES